MTDLRSLTKRALVDRAIAAINEIEIREGRSAKATAIIHDLMDFGHQYDAEDDKCANCGGTEHDHEANYFCPAFVARVSKLEPTNG